MHKGISGGKGRFFLLAGILQILLLVLSFHAWAVPASRALHTLTQYDGTTFQARQWGDEWYHGWETEDGYTIVSDEALQTWTYAVNDSEGNLVSSSQTVGKGNPPAGLEKHLRLTGDALLRLQELRPRVRPLSLEQPAERAPMALKTGANNILVLLINFSDTITSYTAADFETAFFKENNYSLVDYFKENSYNKLSVSSGPGGIQDWWRAPNTHDYYGADDPTNPKNNDVKLPDAILAAVTALDIRAGGFNFAPYDQDGDCCVDTVAVIVQGRPQSSTGVVNDIWPKQSEFQNDYVTRTTCSKGGFIKVKKYTVQTEIEGDNLIATIGTFAHEYGHALGLPDLYDTSDRSTGAGQWTVMAAGSDTKFSRDGDRPSHFDAWSKYYLGWVTPERVIFSLSDVTIPPIEDSPKVYQLLQGTPKSGEYFLVENRQRKKFDIGLPGSGLLVWHIDGNLVANTWEIGKNTVNANPCNNGTSCSTQHYGVALQQADGRWDLEKARNVGNLGDNGDPYPGGKGNTTLAENSTPDSKLYDRSASNVSVTKISASGENMVASLGISYPGAYLNVSETSVTFADRVLTDTTNFETRTLTITNCGPADLLIGTLSAGDTTNFGGVADTCSGARLAYRGTCQIVVGFAPVTAGIKSATLTIPSNTGSTGGAVNPATLVALFGRGVQSGLSAAPAFLDFGTLIMPDKEVSLATAGCEAMVSETATAVQCPVSITNTSASTMTNVGISTIGSQFYLVNQVTGLVTSDSIASITPQKSATVNVYYVTMAGKTESTGTFSVVSGSLRGEVALKAKTNTRPAKPANSLPVNGATGVALAPSFRSSQFSDGDTDEGGWSIWEIASTGTFDPGTVVFESSEDASDLTSISIPPGLLKPNRTYYWRVSYFDSRGLASQPSDVTSFVTETVRMNDNGTTPDETTVKDNSGNEITAISADSLTPSVANVSQRLLADFQAVNAGAGADTTKPGVAIVRANGGLDKDVLGMATPTGTVIDQVMTALPGDPAFAGYTPLPGYISPYGVLSFRVAGVTPGESINVTFYTPNDLPGGTVWQKFDPSRGWLKVDATGTFDASGSLISTDMTFTVVDGKGVLTITDDLFGDWSREQASGKAVVADPGMFALVDVSGGSDGAALPPDGSGTSRIISSGGGGSTGCFIATAAFGSYLHPLVNVLREFRDQILLTNRPGAAFVAWYYRVSPPVADIVAKDQMLRAGLRVALLPVVGFAWVSLAAGFVPALGLILLLLGLLLAAAKRLYAFLR